jgi:hypothetical protein
MEKEEDKAKTPAGEGVPITGDNEVALEFAKKALTDSVNVINEHIKMMIPLTTAVITAYFALLEFLGVKSALETSKMSADPLVDPPIIMLGSLIAFIVISFPLLKKIVVDDLSNVTSYRNFMIAWRYIGAGVGMGLFLYGISNMIFIAKHIIEVGKA